jgi:hypothetical protein
LSLRLVASGAALVLALPLGAQESRVIVGGQGASFVTLSSIALADSAVRRLIETHLPGAFSDGADAHHVTLVLDANGEYVSGQVKKATVVTPAILPSNGERIWVGDSLSGVARVAVRRLDGSSAADVVPGGAVTITRRSTDGTGSSEFDVMGSGYARSEISSIGVRHYTAGELDRGHVIVAIIRLK